MVDRTDNDDPIRIGNPAPDFSVAAVHGDGDIRLADYTGRRSLLLGLFRGLHCPFCRSQVVMMGGYSERLGELGVDSLAIVNTELDRARLYYGRQRPGMALAVDPDWDTHRRYGLSHPKMTLGKTDWPKKINPIAALTLRVNPTGDLPKGVAPIRLNDVVNRIEGFELTAVDRKIKAAHGLTNAGFTLIDKDGIVRWRWLEGAGGFADIAKFPPRDDIIAAVAAAQG